MSIMQEIYRVQAEKPVSQRVTLPVGKPEMLYIGCVDARIDPIQEIGIPSGKAHIFRNVGALVRLGNTDLGATLEMFINNNPLEETIVKHIVVAGHTNCGGIRNCFHGANDKRDPDLAHYLETLKPMRQRIMKNAQAGNWDEQRILHELEQESVRQSVKNLSQYAIVQKKLAEKKLQVHGWVLDILAQEILEMHPETLVFTSMSAIRNGNN